MPQQTKIINAILSFGLLMKNIQEVLEEKGNC